ncbi:hypothetical protein [Pseudomonas kulmbachensis]|uniref:hypothetical protein n=1 Tax=Pseudomonas kulmbachensis TaxID=3043408 RepID=UPI002AB18F84|nr:hypothetical protein [Pseudomonas sp. V3/3/4/13]
MAWKRFESGSFFILLLVAAFLVFACGRDLAAEGKAAAKLLASAGLLATLAGLFQLDISGLFGRILEAYNDSDKYPFGPPSYVTREIIDNPDRPVRTWLRNRCFFDARTGFWIIVIGTLIQVIAVWI